ncbi:hypothetical protein JHK85_002186 [Glycine max]|nr:hypothetical protein JHK85_002186 [Glycine max]
MGKGAGCLHSKKKPPPVADDAPAPTVAAAAPTPPPISPPDNAHAREPDAPAREAASSSSSLPGGAKLKVFIVFYSMYGHVEGLAKRLKKGVDGVEGVEGVLYRVPETLPIEVLNQMRAPPKDDAIPEITAAELTAADGVLFGFPTRYGSMAAQMKAFFDSTGHLWKEQKLAGKPAGFFVSTGTQGGGQETTAGQKNPSETGKSVNGEHKAEENGNDLKWADPGDRCDSKLSEETEKTEENKMEDTVSALRSLMVSHSPPLDALVVPSEDYHLSEYVSARDKRREFVSGFTGSAGLALITKKEALLWTDGRYFLQAEKELSAGWKLMRIGEDPAVDIWMADNLPKEASVGVDPWCISIDTAQRWERAFAEKQQKLVPTSKNLVDEVWINRPPAEINAVIVHPVKFAGRSVADKLKDLRKKLVHEQTRGIIFTALDEVAWLYNIRGSDVAYCPVVHAFAIVTSNSAFIYVDKQKVSVEVQTHLVENGIEIQEYTAVSSDATLLATDELDAVSTAKAALAETEARKIPSEIDKSVNGEHQAEENSNDLIWADPVSCCYALYAKLNPDTVLLQQSPLALAKALKVNSVELDGLKKAHIRDGAAVVQYLVWLDKKMQDIYGASGYFLEKDSVKKEKHLQSLKLTEVTVSDQLEGFRASKEHFKGLSFPTISSVGSNAAIIHYFPKAETCAELDPDKIYLFDSGAQVLKGHIALGNARFPNGTNGHSLDILARIPLWKDGLDYRHGTGHGIGSYLNVHEGPHLISFRPQARNVPLQSSMTVTDEPGYYEDGEFGIRLENVLIVKEADTTFNFGDRGYLSFEHITWAPYQTKLIDLNLLSPEEINWLNSYHATCRNILAPYLDEVENAWLKKATEPVGA